MMYRATYVPEFYRTLHAAVHAEFRARRALTTAAGAFARPWSIGRHTLRDLAVAGYHGARLPRLHRELARLARQAQPQPPTRVVRVLTRQAAAMPAGLSAPTVDRPR
jgi:hypothetical protein